MGTTSYLPPEYLQYLDYIPDLQKCANILITFTPLFSYGTTCYGIYQKKTSTGFSIDICATMIMASILRILYYTITPFEISLLRQSIVMIFIHIILLKISLKYRPHTYNPDKLAPLPVFKNELNSYLPRRLSQSSNINTHDNYTQISTSTLNSYLKLINDLIHFSKCYLIISFQQILKFFDVYYQRPKLFWQWLEEIKYWKFLINFAIFFGILTAIFHKNETYGSFIGILGLFIESLLPLPQILMLNRLKSTKNFKIILLLSWLGGDCTKISYLVFGTDNISIIFILAGLFQMSLDILIAFQYLYFKKIENENNLELNNFELPSFHQFNKNINVDIDYELSRLPSVEIESNNSSN